MWPVTITVYLARSTIRLKLKRALATESTKKRFDTHKLQNHAIHRMFTIQLKNRFQALAVEEQMTDGGEEQEGQVERKRKIMEEAYVKTAEEVLGYKKKKNKPWFSQEAWTLVDQRKAIKQKLIGARSERLKQRWQDEYRQKDREVNRSGWIKEDGLKILQKEAENAANQQRMKTLYTLTKVLSNERPRQSAAVMDKTGKILNDKESKIRRWLEHFSEVLNRENPSNPICEIEIEVPDEIEEIDTSEPSRAKVRKAMGHPKNGKAPGIDKRSIQAELLKADIDYATT